MRGKIDLILPWSSDEESVEGAVSGDIKELPSGPGNINFVQSIHPLELENNSSWAKDSRNDHGCNSSGGGTTDAQVEQLLHDRICRSVEPSLLLAYVVDEGP